MDIDDKTIEIFCCYARKDQALLVELKNHLSELKREKHITLWTDIDMDAGIEWEKEIHRHLNTAQITLLLVSPDFMASDYCRSVEMQRALERHKRGETNVIPIILRPVYWKGEALGKLQALPTDGKPVTTWNNQDDAFYTIVLGIQSAVETFITKGEQLRKAEEAKQARLVEQARLAKVEQEREAEQLEQARLAEVERIRGIEEAEQARERKKERRRRAREEQELKIREEQALQAEEEKERARKAKKEEQARLAEEERVAPLDQMVLPMKAVSEAVPAKAAIQPMPSPQSAETIRSNDISGPTGEAIADILSPQSEAITYLPRQQIQMQVPGDKETIPSKRKEKMLLGTSDSIMEYVSSIKLLTRIISTVVGICILFIISLLVARIPGYFIILGTQDITLFVTWIILSFF
jgi:hypothetical protein